MSDPSNAALATRRSQSRVPRKRRLLCHAWAPVHLPCVLDVRSVTHQVMRGGLAGQLPQPPAAYPPPTRPSTLPLCRHHCTMPPRRGPLMRRRGARLGILGGFALLAYTLWSVRSPTQHGSSSSDRGSSSVLTSGGTAPKYSLPDGERADAIMSGSQQHGRVTKVTLPPRRAEPWRACSGCGCTALPACGEKGVAACCHAAITSPSPACERYIVATCVQAGPLPADFWTNEKRAWREAEFQKMVERGGFPCYCCCCCVKGCRV